MKICFASDIHGGLPQLKRMEEIWKKEQPDQIVLLGDLMYHGPRNPLPEGYDPAGVATLLNYYREKIIAVRGNCDSEVDQMLLEFPMMGDSSILFAEDRKFFLTHGHLFSPEKLPHLEEGAVFVSGHTHIPEIYHKDDLVIFNPGSISLPKNDFEPSYGWLENGMFEVRSLEGDVLFSYKL